MNGRFLILVAAILGFMHLWSHAVPVRGQRPAKATMPDFATDHAHSATHKIGAQRLAARPSFAPPVVEQSVVGPSSAIHAANVETAKLAAHASAVHTSAVNLANRSGNRVAESSHAANTTSLRHLSAGQTIGSHANHGSQAMPFQIPVGLAHGSYRVVSSGGYVGTIHVAGGSNEAGPAIDCSLVQTRQSGETVCFLRLAETSASTVAVVDVNNSPAYSLVGHGSAGEIAAMHVDLAVRVLPAAAATIEPAPFAVDAGNEASTANATATSSAALSVAVPSVAVPPVTVPSHGVCTPVTPKPVTRSAALDFNQFDGWPVTFPFSDSLDASFDNQPSDSGRTNADTQPTTETTSVATPRSKSESIVDQSAGDFPGAEFSISNESVNDVFGLEENKWCTAGNDIEPAN